MGHQFHHGRRYLPADPAVSAGAARFVRRLSGKGGGGARSYRRDGKLSAPAEAPRKRSPSCARIGKLKRAPPKQSELRSDTGRKTVPPQPRDGRSEERRVGKECRSRWWP